MCREQFTGPDDLVFCTELGGHINDDRLRERFYSALAGAGLGDKRAGDDPMVFHDLRHTFGTLAVEAWPLHDVQAYMGHADIQTTMIYVHHQPKAAAADKLSRGAGDGRGNRVANRDANCRERGATGRNWRLRIALKHGDRDD